MSNTAVVSFNQEHRSFPFFKGDLSCALGAWKVGNSKQNARGGGLLRWPVGRSMPTGLQGVTLQDLTQFKH